MSPTKFEHVSSTALLIAAARAVEAGLPDAVVRDPFAARLVGERGAAIMADPLVRNSSIVFGLRTRFIDELLLAELRKGEIGCVVSLGAGLDARPWRLDLPAGLRWIEVDLPGALEEKYRVMEDVPPRCRLESIEADLNVDEDRHRVFAAAHAGGQRILLLTEGLLSYLPEATIQALVTESEGCCRWITMISHGTDSLVSGLTGVMAGIPQLLDRNGLDAEAMLRPWLAGGWRPLASKTMLKDGLPFLLRRRPQSPSQGPSGERPGAALARMMLLPAAHMPGVWLYGRG